MKLEEAIVVLNPNLDNKLIDYFKDYIDFMANKKLSVKSRLDENVRNVFGHSIEHEKISDKVYFKHIQNIITTYYNHYKFKFPKLSIGKLTQIDILKYEIGGKYEAHVDDYPEANRTISCIINLNEDYEGGDFLFYDPKIKDIIKRVQCKKGTIIFFPSNFLYPHRIEPITKGKRYSIVAWLK